MPKDLDEMRDPRDKFKPVEHIQAAAGVKIASPDLEGVLPGSTLYATSDNSEIEDFKKSIEDEMQSAFEIGICWRRSISVKASRDPMASHFRITPFVSVLIKTDCISSSMDFLKFSISELSLVA